MVMSGDMDDSGSINSDTGSTSATGTIRKDLDSSGTSRKDLESIQTTGDESPTSGVPPPDQNSNHELNKSLMSSLSPSSYTRHQKVTLIGMCLAYLFSMMSYSVIAPFFPLEAQKKKVSHTQVGFIFAMYNLIFCLSCPIWGKVIPLVGAKFTFLSGCWLSGGSNIIFGFLNLLHTETQFVVYCYITRSLEAVGAAGSVTAAMVIVANTFPENVAQVTGGLEVFTGLGFAIGPPIGGALYGVGGYKLPFIVVGGAALLIMVVNIFILPKPGTENKPAMGSFRDLLSIPSTWPIVFAIPIGSGSMAFLFTTLSPYIKKEFDLSPSGVGGTFFIFAGIYALFSPVMGYIADKSKLTRLMIVLGFLGAATSYFFVGPVPLFRLPKRLWITCSSLGLLGLAIAASIVPCFLEVLTTAYSCGMPEDLGTQSVVSGILSGLYSLGGFLGPFIGGALVDHIGFPWTSIVFAFANVLVVVVASAFWIRQSGCTIGDVQRLIQKKGRYYSGKARRWTRINESDEEWEWLS